MMSQLNKTTLTTLDVPGPDYDRDAIAPGIVHLGIGAFHRGHLADFTDRAISLEGGDWLIVGASLRSARVRDQLRPQDYLYSLVVNDGHHQSVRIIGALHSVIPAPEDPRRLIDAMASPGIHVVTLTITEKGYCHDPASGAINWEHPDIAYDLDHYRQSPRSAIGFLAAALELRAQSHSPLTLLSCDNLSHNGHLLERVLKAFVSRTNPALSTWLNENTAFPCSMVDRIVPAVTEERLSQLAREVGVEDAGAIFTEGFSQWIIEDSFAGPRPGWESAGAMLVEDVTPFEDMKLRLLNGSHSLIAYLGFVAGYDYVHEVMQDRVLNELVCNFMHTVDATVEVPGEFSLDDYKKQLQERFANVSLGHRTAQIAMDGSQKIPQRWLPPLRHLLSEGSDCSLFALALAAWIRYLDGVRDSGGIYSVDDPMIALINSKQEAGGDCPVELVLGIESIFGNLSTEHPVFSAKVRSNYELLKQRGIQKGVAAALVS